MFFCKTFVLNVASLPQNPIINMFIACIIYFLKLHNCGASCFAAWERRQAHFHWINNGRLSPVTMVTDNNSWTPVKQVVRILPRYASVFSCPGTVMGGGASPRQGAKPSKQLPLPPCGVIRLSELKTFRNTHIHQSKNIISSLQ